MFLVLFSANVASGVGVDLVSLNIARGRDHGIPKYNDLRRGLEMGSAQFFTDISKNSDIANKLSVAYGDNIEEVDAWIGGLGKILCCLNGSPAIIYSPSFAI